ncbi:MAG TPA: carboxypeptidase-like regulatory domain-containing protein, partial [Blastocatellia bacterium]|nr:carboxypeptidase-like regulatory domain-containing protein [Blastocatellia bacterium]
MNCQHATQMFLFMLLLLPLSVGAQSAQTPTPPPPPTTMSISIGAPTTPTKAWTGKRGTITGRVVSDDGQPFANIGVNLFSIAADRNARRMVTTDEEGSFKVNDLPSGAYRINAFVPGYVNPENTSGLTAARATSYRLGESATITMTKGGVITGKANDSSGQPLVAASVQAYRVRDSEGRSVDATGLISARGITDDRGIYRIFGLQSGSYVVATDGGGETPTSAREVAT